MTSIELVSLTLDAFDGLSEDISKEDYIAACEILRDSFAIKAEEEREELEDDEL